MPPSLKLGLRWLGGALAIVGIVYVLLRLRAYGNEIDLARFNGIEWSEMAAFALIYGLSNLMLALAWWNLLQNFKADTTRRWAIKTYGISQLAKYVPGNIFHLAGRQALGMAAGVPGWPLAKSSIWELSLAALAGAVLGMFALPLKVIDISVQEVGVVFIIAVIVTVAILQKYATLSAAKAFAWYVLFFGIASALFVGLIEIISPISITNASFCIVLVGAYALAWLAGFLTPGAPAGLGVREFVLLFLLQGHVAGADLLLAILLGRAVSVCGDLLFFMFALLAGGRKHLISV